MSIELYKSSLNTVLLKSADLQYLSITELNTIDYTYNHYYSKDYITGLSNV